MTPPDDVPRDGSRDDPPKGTPDGPVEPELPFDEEAAWRMIVENYGERALNISPDSIYTGALGAAMFAQRGAQRAAA